VGIVVSETDAMVCVVDDDFRVREALQSLLASAGFAVQTFGSAAEYVAAARPDVAACLVLDVGLPDINGLDLQHQLSGLSHPRIVFITGQGDIPSSVRACRAGAIDFLTKPFSDTQLLGAVQEAIAQDRADRELRSGRQRLEQRLATLTPREREVLPLVVSGLLNKQAAAVLGISEITLQIHRSKIMRKLNADSLPELVRMTEALGIAATHSRRART
jgi:FixJ family two-component response regulator